MRRILMTALYALAFTVGTMLAPLPASANHNVPEITVGEPGQCGEVSFVANWTQETHTVANTQLVVDDGTSVHLGYVGETITVGPFETATQTIRYRVWGGGERDYDVPALTDLDALLVYLESGGMPTDAGAAGVTWLELEVNGCVPSPAPTPTAVPTPEPTPTAGPTAEPTPSTAPSATPAAPGGLAVTPGAPWKTLAVLGVLATGLIGGGWGLLRLRRRLGTV